ncbi:hypothetical protein Y032_0033g2678 [Ancylostoma ceylanicum]|uniref:Uncharacterized protein n=1 Tax=Ancylostoma ceylanicum TaxID=53326 RepID=A0A016UPT4_9BILA|nr:hypothetical protein Y032_0033g2678 [Ancylostoma ceylanicum]
MSLSDLEEYCNNYKTMAQKGSTSKKCKLRRNGKHNHVFVTKTLYDPANTLSKREQKRLLANRSDGFCPDVPYSMNKQERWSKVTVSSLLNGQELGSLDRLIISRTDVPSTASVRAGTISNVKVLDEDAIATLSAGRRRKPLSYFNGQLRERINLDKDEAEPARIHFSIITPFRPTACSTKKSKRTNRRDVKVGQDEYSDNENNDCMPENLEEDDDRGSNEISRKITLGDFLAIKRVVLPKKPEINSTDFEHDSTEKQLATTPARLVEIEEPSNAHNQHIFEVVEFDIESLKSFDLKEDGFSNLRPLAKDPLNIYEESYF